MHTPIHTCTHTHIHSYTQSDSSVGVLQKTIRSLEHKLAAAQNELTSSQLALSQAQQEYNSYKVGMALLVYHLHTLVN